MNSPVTEHPYRQAIAAEVRAAMARAGVDQKTLLNHMAGEGSVMAPASLSDRLAGKRAFNTDQLAAVAQALGVDPLDFLSVPSRIPAITEGASA